MRLPRPENVAIAILGTATFAVSFIRGLQALNRHLWAEDVSVPDRPAPQEAHVRWPK